MYKPGQIVTINRQLYRLFKWDNSLHCPSCDLYQADVTVCKKYCYRRHNDFNKYPWGYVLKRIHPKSQKG